MNPYRRHPGWHTLPRRALGGLATLLLWLFVLAVGGAALRALDPVPQLAQAAPSFTGPLPAAISVPPCGCADDGAGINAALASGRPVTLKRGATYTTTTPIVPPSNAELHLAGATINSAVLTGGPSWSATICAGATGGTPLTLAAQTTAGASSFTVTAAGLVVGRPVYIAYIPAGPPNFGQAFTVAAITGSSNPYTVTIADGRTLAWAYPTSTTVVLASPTLPTNVRIYGEGATINVTSSSQPRGIQLATCQGCLVQDLTIAGLSGWGISYDIGGYHSVLRDLVIDGALVAGAPAMSVGVGAEACEGCRYENLRIRGAAVGGYFYGATGSIFDQINVAQPGATVGIQLDGNTSFGSTGSILGNSSVQSGAVANKFATGLLIADQSSGWTVRDVAVVGASTDGVLVETQTSGVPDALTMSGLNVSGSGAVGIDIVNATNAILNAPRATGNPTGVNVASSAGRVQVLGGQIGGNTYGMQVAASVAVSGTSLADNTSFAINASGGAYRSTLHGVTITRTTGSATFYGLYLANTGRWDLSGVTVDSTGATGLALLYNPAGSGGAVYCQNCVAAGGASSYGFYASGAGMYFYYDASSDPSGAATPTGGTAATPSIGFASLH